MSTLNTVGGEGLRQVQTGTGLPHLAMRAGLASRDAPLRMHAMARSGPMRDIGQPEAHSPVTVPRLLKRRIHGQEAG